MDVNLNKINSNKMFCCSKNKLQSFLSLLYTSRFLPLVPSKKILDELLFTITHTQIIVGDLPPLGSLLQNVYFLLVAEYARKSLGQPSSSHLVSIFPFSLVHVFSIKRSSELDCSNLTLHYRGD